MGQANRKQKFENLILHKLSERKLAAGGNSGRTLLSVAQDMLLACGRQNSGVIAKDCFMAKATIDRIMDADNVENYDNYKPRADTLERVFKYCNAKMLFDDEFVKGKHQNQPRPEY